MRRRKRHSDERHSPLRRNRGPRVSHNDRSGVRGLCFEWKTQALICRPSGMPRDGAIIFSDLIGKLDVLRMAWDILSVGCTLG
jgi:hypothetical protein